MPPTLHRLALALRVAAERRHLASLDPHIAADLGLSRAAIDHEARRTFWDLPAARMADLDGTAAPSQRTALSPRHTR